MSNYIMDLRKVVGHAPLLQAGASIIVENENGQVLLEKRTDNHQWGYAGGSIELGETVEEAAKRDQKNGTGNRGRAYRLRQFYGSDKGRGSAPVPGNGRKGTGTPEWEESSGGSRI